MAVANKAYVAIVGAGPSGLLLALLLARNKIPVQIIDVSNKVDEQPRATHYGTAAVLELDRAGVLDEVRAAGFNPGRVCWRKLDGTYIAGIDGNLLSQDPDRMVCLPLNQLCEILHRHLLNEPYATISWDHKVRTVGQDDEKAWVEVETSGALKTIEASYIVGCDGANSQIRRSLFGDWEFPGKTWKEQIVATNVSFLLGPPPK